MTETYTTSTLPTTKITEVLPGGLTRSHEIIDLPPGKARLHHVGFASFICDDSRLDVLEAKLDRISVNVLKSDLRDHSPSANLDNDIAQHFSEDLDLKKGDDIMASKYKERVKVGTDADDKPIYAWACGSTKEELHRSIAAILSASATKEAVNKKDIPTWDTYAHEWYTTFHRPKIRPKTADKDDSLLKNHVEPAFAGKPIDTISTKDIQNYLQSKAHYSKSQVRDIMGMLKQIFAFALEDGLIARNPMDSASVYNPSAKTEKVRQALTPEEQADIIAHLGNLKEPNARRLMAFLMFTPLRPCEIYGLQWSDIDLQRNTIRIQRDLVFAKGKAVLGPTKTADSNRAIPLDDVLRQYLEPFHDDGFIICMTQPGRVGEHLSSDSCVRWLWKRIGKAIDLHGMTPYTGRHTYATNMSRAGVPIKTAMSYMGHTDERMLLRRYTHVDQSDLVNANRTVTDYLTGLTSGL